MRKFDFKNKEINQEQAIKYLGLRSILINKSSFQSESSFNEALKEIDTILLTDRFYGNQIMSFGSSRHVILKDLQAKGTGQNLLNTAFDYPYQWGGYKRINALHAMICELVANKRTKKKCFPTVGVFDYANSFDGLDDLCILYRKNNSFRLANVWPSSLNKKEIEYVKKSFEDAHETNSPIEILENLIDQIIHAFSVGVCYATPSLGNLTLSGEWIDTESLLIQKSKQCSSLEISIVEADYQKLFFDSWIHNLYLQCKLYSDVIEGLYESQTIEIKPFIQASLNKYMQDIDGELWLKLLDTYPSWRILNYSGEEHTELKTFKNEFNLETLDFEVKDYHSPYIRGKVKTFSLNDHKELIHESILKLFPLFQKKGLSWSQALKNYELLKKAVDDHL